MSALEVNKIVGAVLAALLLFLGIRFVGELIYHGPGGAEGHGEQAERAYPIGGDLPIGGVEDVESVAGDGADHGEAAVAPEASSLAVLLAAADLGAGQKEAKKCVACHSFDEGGKAKIGPNLWDVVGAPKAGVEGFKYSATLAGMGGTWTYDALDGFLASPKTYAAGTKMAFPGVRDESKRAAVIAYLRSLSNAPAPLP